MRSELCLAGFPSRGEVFGRTGVGQLAAGAMILFNIDNTPTGWSVSPGDGRGSGADDQGDDSGGHGIGDDMAMGFKNESTKESFGNFGN